MALPGEVRKHHKGEQCEYDECTANAVYEVCTESDSFGDEWEPRCEDHLPDPNAKDLGDCDHCEAQDVEVVPTRDPEEIHGPVSYLCPACLSRHRQYVRELNESYHDELDEYDEDDDEDDEDVRTPEEQEEDVRKMREMFSNELPRLIDEHNEHRSFSQFAPGELKRKVHKYPSKKDDE